MSHTPFDDEKQPTIGEDIDLPVVSSPMRTTLFPENFVLLSPSPEIMEIAFLRQELTVLSQRGHVIRSSDGSVDLQVGQTAVVGQIQDLGHIRMSPDKMVELAKALVLHAKAYHKLDAEAFLRELANSPALASTDGGVT